MDSRRARLIAEVIKHLEDMDATHLKGEMAPPPVEEEVAVEAEPAVEASDKGPMEMLADKGRDPASDVQDEEMSDEELEELARLGG